MQEFLTWTLEAIREDGTMMSWMEERRFDWCPVTSNAVKQILDGRTLIIITDKQRHWFAQYIATSLNRPTFDRPLMSVSCIDHIYPNYDDIVGGERIDMLSDMLSLAYKDEYFFWYIGKGEDSRADIARRSENSFIWAIDEEVQNSFWLQSYDKLLDIKLLQLFHLFERTLNATLFGEIELTE